MPLDIYPDISRDMNDYVQNQPAFGPPQDFGEGFESALNASANTWRLLRVQQNYESVVTDWTDAFKAQTGYAPDAFGGQLPGQFNYDALNKAYQTEKSSRPNFDMPPPPTPDQAWQSAIGKEQDIAAQAAGPRGQQKSLGGQLGSVLGGLAGQLDDPSTLAIIGVGALAPEAAGVVSTAIRGALELGGQQLFLSGENYPVSKALNPDYGIGDVLSEAGGAALGGAVLGGGLRGIAAAFSSGAFAGRLADFRGRR